jgi:hypothetical protein
MPHGLLLGINFQKKFNILKDTVRDSSPIKTLSFRSPQTTLQKSLLSPIESSQIQLGLTTQLAAYSMLSTVI